MDIHISYVVRGILLILFASNSTISLQIQQKQFNPAYSTRNTIIRFLYNKKVRRWLPQQFSALLGAFA
jgi:hypothetical protein